MRLAARFGKLTFWNKLGTIGAICSILGFLGWLLCCNSGTMGKVDVSQSPDAKVQTAVNSPGATQIIADQVIVKIAPSLERKLVMTSVHVNKPVGGKFESLFEGKLDAPYPVPTLYARVHGKTVEEISLHPIRSGPFVVNSFHGKREGYIFMGLHNAIGRLRLKIITREADKLSIRFSVDE